jgi:O-antigen/teichoic acid export membrane protein
MSDRRGLTSRVVHGSLLQFGGQGITMLATLISTPFTIRLLGAASYGILTFVQVLIGYFSVADLGMGMASTRFGSVAHARGDDDEEATVIWSALLLAVIPAATIAVIWFLGARPFVERGLRLPPYLHAPAVICMRIAAVGFLMRAIVGVLNTPALVRIRMDLVALVVCGTATAQIILVPIVVSLGGGLPGAVAVVAGAATASALLYAIIGLRLLPQLRRPRISGALLKQLIAFGAAMMVSLIATALLGQSEKLLMPRYASVEALAYYSVAFTLAYMLTQLPVATVQSLVPAFSQLHVNPDRTDLERLYRRALHAMLFWALPGATFICIAAEPFFTLWAGPQFGRESTLPLYLLIGGVVCETLAFVPNGLLIAFGRTDLIARAQLSLLVPYVAAAAFLIHHFGAPGAAIAWSVRAILNLGLFAHFARRTSGFAFVPWPDNKRDYALAVAALLLPFAAAPFVSPFVRIGIAAVAIAVYGIVVFTRVLTADERAALQRLLPI